MAALNTTEETSKTTLSPISSFKSYHLKVVISQASIVPAAIATATLESGVLNRMDRGLLCRVSRRDPCPHAQRVCRVSLKSRTDSLVGAYLSPQKREKSFVSVCCWLLYPIQLPPFLARKTNNCQQYNAEEDDCRDRNQGERRQSRLSPSRLRNAVNSRISS